MSRKCEKCGTIDFGIWGYPGFIGYSLIVGIMGYVISQLFYAPMIVIFIMILGIILLLPMYGISLQEQRRNKKEKEDFHPEPTRLTDVNE